MSEFQLTHVALVGARMPLFHRHGYRSRDELTMRRVPPDLKGLSLAVMPRARCRSLLQMQFSLWIHNIITDPQFPGRDELLMPLRRFEGELSDSRENEVVSAVLSAGFRSQTLDPLNLPQTMPTRQRCALVMHLATWQEAYRRLEQTVLDMLCTRADQLDAWTRLARQPEHVLVDPLEIA